MYFELVLIYFILALICFEVVPIYSILALMYFGVVPIYFIQAFCSRTEALHSLIKVLSSRYGVPICIESMPIGPGIFYW